VVGIGTPVAVVAIVVVVVWSTVVVVVSSAPSLLSEHATNIRIASTSTDPNFRILFSLVWTSLPPGGAMLCRMKSSKSCGERWRNRLSYASNGGR
jgi:hypothetical protein